MKTWDEVVKKGLEMLEHKDEYAYFYGAKGQVLTDATMQALWDAEPVYFARYNEKQKKEIFNYSRGKIGFDCSGFVSHCVGDKTWSRGLWDHCSKKLPNVYEGVAGSIVYKTGHVGLDIGYGFYVHMGREMHSVELGRFRENTCAWEGSGEHKDVDYTGATNR